MLHFSPSRTLKTIALSLGVLATLFLASVVVLAWTDPSQTPPGANVPAPINVGPTAQTKAGALTIAGGGGDALILRNGGDLRLYNAANSGSAVLYVDNNGEIITPGNLTVGGNVGIGTAGPTQKLDVIGYVRGSSGLCIGNDCRSSWPAANFGDWYFSGDNLISNGWGHIYTSSSNLHLDSYSGEMYLNYYYNNWVNVGNRDTGYLFIGNTQLYDDNDWFRIYSGANNRIYTNSYLRVDNGLEVNGRIYANEWIQFNNYSGLYSPLNGAHFYPNNASYGSWRVAGSRNGWQGLEFDAAGGQLSLMMGHTSQGWGGQQTGIHNNSYGWLWYFIHGNLYADMMYDKNNTGYYVDPASTSRLNYGVFDNIYSYGWIQGPIFYDANNTGYYVDPASTSNINVLTMAGGLGTMGRSPSCPNGWGCGVHTWDVYADASIRTHSLCLGGGVGTSNTGDCRSSWSGGGISRCRICFWVENDGTGQTSTVCTDFVGAGQSDWSSETAGGAWIDIAKVYIECQ